MPELKGVYVFATFTGKIYAVQLSDNRNYLVKEIQANPQLFPFVPIISITQSPDGKIYFGSYGIFTLDSLGEMRQNAYDAQIDSPPAIDLTVPP